MHVDIRESAIEPLQRIARNKGQGVRIAVQEMYQGGCGCERVVSLVLSDFLPGDETVCVDGIPLLMDEFAREILGDRLILRYIPLVGFILATSEQTIAYGLQLKG